MSEGTQYLPLHSVVSSMISCLHGLLPDHLSTDPIAFEKHSNFIFNINNE